MGSCVTPKTVSGQDRKPHSEIVAELERKERRAANHAFEIQWVVDNKGQLLSQAEEGLQAHLVVASRKSLKNTHAKQVRHFARKLTILTPPMKPLPMKRRRKESEVGDEKEGRGRNGECC